MCFGNYTKNAIATPEVCCLRVCPTEFHNEPTTVDHLPVPKVGAVGYNDDIALVVIAEHLEDGEFYSYKVISAVRAWLESSILILSGTKRRSRN